MAENKSGSSQDARAPQPGQLATALPGLTTFITGHAADGKARVYAERPAAWTPFDNKNMAFNVVYTTSFPADLIGDADVLAHDDVVASKTLGLVKPGGTVCRQVDFAPGYTSTMHRTSSLDYGIVLEGVAEMLLDDGSVTVIQRGDVAVQRATMHAWRNPSETEWLRMIFILQDVQKVVVNGEVYGEDLGNKPGGIPSSGRL